MSPSMMPLLLNRVAQLGEICILKVYRDWSKEDSKKWIEYYNTYRFEAIQCFRQVKKQSTDVYMITDLCNDIYTNFTISHILLATTDSDFIHLCHLIIRLGKKLVLVGKDKNLANLCYQFWYYNDLLQDKNNTLIKEINLEENNNLEEESNKLKNKKSKKNIESISSHIYFEDDIEDKLNNSIYLEKVNMNNDSLLDYLILGMNNNYIMYISELKKNLKNIDPQNQSKMNWRKIETELKKFPTEFLVINKKSKILVLMVPDLLKPHINKNKIIEIVSLKYNDILKEISINSLLKKLI